MIYVPGWKPAKKIDERELPPYPDPRRREKLSLVLGEFHDPRMPVPSPSPFCTEIPERGLNTGSRILAPIGASKTTGCILPYTDQAHCGRTPKKPQGQRGQMIRLFLSPNLVRGANVCFPNLQGKPLKAAR